MNPSGKRQKCHATLGAFNQQMLMEILDFACWPVILPLSSVCKMWRTAVHSMHSSVKLRQVHLHGMRVQRRLCKKKFSENQKKHFQRTGEEMWRHGILPWGDYDGEGDDDESEEYENVDGEGHFPWSDLEESAWSDPEE